MDTVQGVSEELRTAAAAHGPKYQQPAYVRAAFPLVALPRVLRGFVKQAAEALGVAPECIATPAIATCATAIGNTCRIRITPTWTEPSVIWAITVMESGSLKTPSYNMAVEPLRKAQLLLERQYQQAQKDYRNAKAQFEAEASLWKNATTPEAGSPAPAEPVEPKPVDLYTSDCTVEALALIFGNNPRGVAFTRDELSGWFASFGAYKGGKGGDEAAYLEFYNAGAVKLNRASGKRVIAHKAAMSIFGTCQPAVFCHAIGADGKNVNQVDNGLAARFLIAAPEARPKRWLEDKPYDPRPYHKLITELLSIPLPLDAEGQPEPAIISMLPEATERYCEFVNEHGDQTMSFGNTALRYHYAKLAGVVGRLALIFYLCDAATGELVGPPGVQERHILAGIALARWYGREAYRVYEGYETAADRERRELLRDIEDHGGTIRITEMRELRRRWRDPLAAELALKALARAGYGVLSIDEASPKGGTGAMRFTLCDPPAPPAPPPVPPVPPTPGFVDFPEEGGTAE